MHSLLLLLLLLGSCSFQAQPARQVLDLKWAEEVVTQTEGSGAPLFQEGITFGNATVLSTPSGPFLSYWQLQQGASLEFRRVTILTTCERLDAIKPFLTPEDNRVLPSPAVWVSRLVVTRNGATQVFLDTTFSCVPLSLSCRKPGSEALPAPNLIISSEWQLIAALDELARASTNRAKDCPPVWSYTMLFNANVSLTAALPLLPATPYSIASNMTLAPADPSQTTILDLAEVWNLTRPLWEQHNTRFWMYNLTLVNLATAPPFAITFPVWAINLGSRGAASALGNGSRPLQLYNCRLVVPEDELRYVGTFGSFFTAPTADATQLANWLRFAVNSLSNVQQVDAQTLTFGQFGGLGVESTNLTLTSKPIPGFPLMHQEAGLARLMDSPLDAYPYVIMVDDESMLLDFTQQSRLDEALFRMKVLQYDVESVKVVLALTRSISMTPALWQAAARLINTPVTIQAWPQSMPISLSMGNTLNLLAIRDNSSATITFRDLILTDLPVVATWSPDMQQVNQALQGAVHAVKFDRSTERINLKRAVLAVSPEELALRSACLDPALLAINTSLEGRCLEAKLFVPEGATANDTSLHIMPPASSPTPSSGWGTVLIDVTFTSQQVLQGQLKSGTLQPARPDLKQLNLAESGNSSSSISHRNGAIIGGVVGGVLGSVALLVVCVLWWKRHSRNTATEQAEVCTPKQQPSAAGQAFADASTSPGGDNPARDSETGQVQVMLQPESTLGDTARLSPTVLDPQAASSMLVASTDRSMDNQLATAHLRADTAPDEPTANSTAHATMRPSATASGEEPRDSSLFIRSLSAPQPAKSPASGIALRYQPDGIASINSSGGHDAQSRLFLDAYPVATPSFGTKSEANSDIRDISNGASSCKQSPSPWNTLTTDSPYASNSGRTRRLSLVSELSQMTRDMEAKICDQPLEIIGVIGSGGYSTVYRGMWQGLLVAVKTVIFARGTDNSALALQEAAISKSISHPNIIATYFYDLEPIGPGNATVSLQQGLRVMGGPALAASGLTGSGSSEWRLYLIMEFCDARSLHHEIHEGKIRRGMNGVPHMRAVLELAFQIATGMAHLHSKHIIHGDLKPENVLLKSLPGSPLGVVVKLADFGLSVSMNERQSHVSNWYKGTPFYVSPEVCSTRKMSKASDVFAYGVILWELFHGKLVWRKHPGNQALEVQPEFPTFPVTCPPAYAQLTAACIQEDPADRPRFDQIISTLHSIAYDLQAAQMGATF